MRFDNPYDQREQEARDEDRRQALQDGAEEAMNEARQLGGMGAYWASLDLEDKDATYEHGDPKRSDFLDGED